MFDMFSRKNHEVSYFTHHKTSFFFFFSSSNRKREKIAFEIQIYCLEEKSFTSTLKEIAQNILWSKDA